MCIIVPILLRKDAGKYLRDKGIQISDHHIYQLLRSGSIPHYKIGNRYLVSTEVIEEYLQKEMMKNIVQDTPKIRAIK